MVQKTKGNMKLRNTNPTNKSEVNYGATKCLSLCQVINVICLYFSRSFYWLLWFQIHWVFPNLSIWPFNIYYILRVPTCTLFPRFCCSCVPLSRTKVSISCIAHICIYSVSNLNVVTTYVLLAMKITSDILQGSNIKF